MEPIDIHNSLEAQELFEHHTIHVDAGQSTYRIDKFLLDRLPHTSRNRIQVAIDNKFILVNGKSTKPSYKVLPRDIIQIVLSTPPHPAELLPEAIPLDIVYEDEHLLIVHKPAGMVVHPGYNNWTGTLMNALVYHVHNLPNNLIYNHRPGLVHRIDKDTSGLLVIAKTEFTLVALAKQFFDHTIERTYYALVWGEPDPVIGTIDISLNRSQSDRRVVAPYADETKGKRAITHYQVVQPLQYVSLVKCNLETGRTHQIRAHMQHIGHPIFGDTTYGGKQLVKGQAFTQYKAFVESCWEIMPRQALHAYSLGFTHPVTQESLFFEAPLPADFQMVLDKWTKYAHYHQLT